MFLLDLVAWALLIRPWAQDWKHGSSDIRDWIIPVAAFLSLRTCLHQGSGKAIKPFLAVVMVTAVLGIYQGATGQFRPFISAGARLKLRPNWEALIGPGWEQSNIFSLCELHSERANLSEGAGLADDFSQGESPVPATPPFAVGFFSHPNSMAMFLSAGFMLALGQAIDSSGFRRWVNPEVIELALIWTLSLGAYAVVAFELIAYFVLRYTRSAKVTVVTVLVSLSAVVGLLAALPPSTFNPLCWRYGLWTTAFDLLTESPLILAFGNGMHPYGDLAYNFQRAVCPSMSCLNTGCRG